MLQLIGVKCDTAAGRAAGTAALRMSKNLTKPPSSAAFPCLFTPENKMKQSELQRAALPSRSSLRVHGVKRAPRVVIEMQMEIYLKKHGATRLCVTSPVCQQVVNINLSTASFIRLQNITENYATRSIVNVAYDERCEKQAGQRSPEHLPPPRSNSPLK